MYLGVFSISLDGKCSFLFILIKFSSPEPNLYLEFLPISYVFWKNVVFNDTHRILPVGSKLSTPLYFFSKFRQIGVYSVHVCLVSAHVELVSADPTSQPT
jgi:hypothetical protein